MSTQTVQLAKFEDDELGAVGRHPPGRGHLRAQPEAKRFRAETADGDPQFVAWLQEDLGPTLKPGDIALMSNSRLYRVKGIAEAIAARSATLKYLPPYAPDLNLIELCSARDPHPAVGPSSRPCHPCRQTCMEGRPHRAV